MCWVMILIVLVPALVTSAGVSSALLGTTSVISITTHQHWLKLSSLLFFASCYYFSANDMHTERDRMMTPWERMYSLCTMGDVGMGSGPELTMLLAGLIALSHAPVQSTKIAISSLAVLALCIMEWKRRLHCEKRKVHAKKHEYHTNSNSPEFNRMPS